MIKYIPSLFILLLLTPSTSEARYNRVDRSDLDDEIVESFSVPVLFGVDFSSVFSDFGDPRGGGTRSHEGQDFLAPQGTPIVTPTEAIVISVGTWTGGGKYVQTANPGGETFRYMHLDEQADLERGDELKMGDYIGTVGDTGNAAAGQYHLHFEVLDEDGDPQDPYTRIDGEFDIEDQMEFLADIFRSRRDDAAYAEFLVESFPEVFKQALADDVDMPTAIENAIEAEGWTDEVIDKQAEITRLKALVTQLRLQLQILLLQKQLAALQLAK